MKQFEGFPARMEFTPIPNLFFGALLPQISDMAELKTTLYILAILYRKRGHPRFVTYRELLGNTGLMSSLKIVEKATDEVLRGALKTAVERGTIVHLILDRDGVAEDVYFVNNEANRQVVEKVKSGEYELSGLKATGQAYIEAEELPDIFTLYEQNIGMLTPIVAEDLRDAANLYPEIWIRDAIREAVSLNKRNIRYITRILERWSAEGRSDGTHRRYPKTDPDKYIKGKYGHMVRR